MLRSYTYQDNCSKAYIKINTDDLHTLSYYSANYQMVQYLLKVLFHISSCTMEFISQEMFYEAVLGANYVIKTNDQKINLEIKGDEVTFYQKDNYLYRFKVTSSSYGIDAELVELNIYQKDRTLIEKMDSDKIVMEIHFNNMKTCVLEVPIRTDRVFDPSYCNFIKSDSDLSDLKRFYMQYFYPSQCDFERNNCSTILSIWYRTLANERLEKGIKCDEIVIMGGAIVNSLVSTNLDGTGMMSVKDNKLMVEGIDLVQIDSLDNIGFNEGFQRLVRKLKKLK